MSNCIQIILDSIRCLRKQAHVFMALSRFFAMIHMLPNLQVRNLETSKDDFEKPIPHRQVQIETLGANGREIL